MQKWIASLDEQWEPVYKREVSRPFDEEMEKLRQQYSAALEANLSKVSNAGNLDEAVSLRAERDRFAAAKDVPAEDEASASPVVKQLRAGWRAQSAKLEKDRTERAKAVFARYDQVLSQAQMQLTQRQRFDDALLVKSKREALSAKWLGPVAGSGTTAPAAGAGTASTVAGSSSKASTPSPASAKLPERPKRDPHEVLRDLLAVGADVRFIDPKSPRERRDAHKVSDVPENFEFLSVDFRAKPGITFKDDDVALIEDIPSLAFLGFRGAGITDAALTHLRALPKLKWVTFENLPNVTGENLQFFADLPSLEHLQLMSMPLNETLLKAIATQRKTSILDLRQTPVTDAGLAALAGMPSLSSVWFQNTTGVTAAGLGQFIKTKHLTNLSLEGFDIDDAMAAQIGKMNGLVLLDIRNAKVSEAGVVALSGLTKLEKFTLIDPPVTPPALAAYKKMRALTRFDIGKQAPEESVAALRAALKGVEVRQQP